MRKVESPLVPGFKAEREAGLQAMTVRRLRLWQRLIEIGAYWEKVSGGSKSLSVNGKSAAQMKRQVAAAAATGASSAGVRGSQVAGGIGQAAANGTAGGSGIEGVGAASRESTREGAGEAPPQANGGGGSGSSTASQAASTGAREGTDQPASRPSTGVAGGGEGTAAASQARPATGTGESASEADQERPTPMEANGSSAGGAVVAKPEPDGGVRPTAADGEGVWAYGVLNALIVVWYCPPGGGEGDRLSNKPQLEEYWRKSYGHDRVPEHFTFLDKDAPPHWTRVGVDRCGAELRPAKKEEVAAAAAAAAASAAGETPRDGVEFSCVYCSKATGPRVKEHLERCYRKVRVVRFGRNESRSIEDAPTHHPPQHQPPPFFVFRCCDWLSFLSRCGRGREGPLTPRVGCVCSLQVHDYNAAPIVRVARFFDPRELARSARTACFLCRVVALVYPRQAGRPARVRLSRARPPGSAAYSAPQLSLTPFPFPCSSGPGRPQSYKTP